MLSINLLDFFPKVLKIKASSILDDYRLNPTQHIIHVTECISKRKLKTCNIDITFFNSV